MRKISIFVFLLIALSANAQISKVYTITSQFIGGDMKFCIGTLGPTGLPNDIILSDCGPSPYTSSGAVFPTATKAGTYVVEVAVEGQPGIEPASFSIQVFPGTAAKLVRAMPGPGPLGFTAGATLSIPLLTSMADQYGNILE